MKRFLPFVFALAFTSLAIAFTLFVARPGIRAIRMPKDWRHRVAEAIEELTEPEEGER